MMTAADKAEAAATVESTADYRLWKCSWCEAEGRETWYDENGYLPPQNISKEKISHGMCTACATKAFKNLPQPVLTRKGSPRSAAPEISRPELTIGCGVNLENPS